MCISLFHSHYCRTILINVRWFLTNLITLTQEIGHEGHVIKHEMQSRSRYIEEVTFPRLTVVPHTRILECEDCLKWVWNVTSYQALQSSRIQLEEGSVYTFKRNVKVLVRSFRSLGRTARFIIFSIKRLAAILFITNKTLT